MTNIIANFSGFIGNIDPNTNYNNFKVNIKGKALLIMS